MGLFSKKTYVCEVCGKEYERRINLLGNLCNDCWNQQEKERCELEKAVKGYKKYQDAFCYKEYSVEMMREIIDHREALLERFLNEEGISKEELYMAGKNYKSLTDEAAMDIIGCLLKTSVNEQYGAGYTTKFFALTDYENVIVDAEDVFAVAYTTDSRGQASGSEVLLCAVFTNDPYVPVFPMVFVLKKGMFELGKSKEGRLAVTTLFENRCPNLTYPVGELNELKKMLKKDGAVKGKIDLKTMQHQIGNALTGIGIFDTRKTNNVLSEETTNMLSRIGYIPESEANDLLNMKDRACAKYWTSIADKMASE